MSTTASLDEGATPDEPQMVAPVGQQRLLSLDFIRGIAVMGILAANIVAFGQPWSAYMYPDGFVTPHGEAEDWMWIAQFVLIDHKMRGLFTILFGAGMMLFLEKAWAKGATNWLQARRLGWLFLFGLAHFFLIWRGDILMLYAVAGLLALLFTHLKAREQLLIGGLWYLAGMILFAAMMIPSYLIAETSFGTAPALAEVLQQMQDAKAKQLADDAMELSLAQGGNLFAWLGHGFEKHALDPFNNLIVLFLETVPLMLIGMALYRMGLFDGTMMDATTQRRRGWLLLVIGAAMSLAIGLWAKSIGFSFFGVQAAFMGMTPLPQLLMTLGLAMLLSLWAPKATGWLGERVIATGRMAFSNYIGTSILMQFVFQGWALGLYGELTRGGLYLVVLGACVVMLAWSKPWLAHYRYGPLEWLWRCLTYGRMFPLRR
ncbi:MAG: DUF418 domain-containing protein [Sphingomonadaceae bacterium]|nr:DUF418 domain-containing protein [Sphingomonadaceae bacterium]